MTGNFSKLNNGNYDLTATLEFSEKLETETVKKEIKKVNWVEEILKINYKSSLILLDNIQDIK